VYEAKDYDYLIGTNGLSEPLLRDHFSLYEAYVANTNRLVDALEGLARTGKHRTPEFAELKRCFAFEFNGMRLHELYFENLGGVAPLDPSSGLAERLGKAFGSFENWRADFAAVALMRGVGWAILYEDPDRDRLFNEWVNEHESGHLASCRPLLVLDLFEHAFLLDYGLKREEYVESFFAQVDWTEVEDRLGGDRCSSES
jgi:Fe-Mn family superoxide dismutase